MTDPKEKGPIAVGPSTPAPNNEENEMSKTTIQQEDRRNHELARKAAEATKCGYEGCDGLMHEAFIDPSEWHHQVYAQTFDGGIIEASISRAPDGTYEGDIFFGGNGTMTADEFRQAATDYVAFPAWLLDFAIRLDVLNGGH